MGVDTKRVPDCRIVGAAAQNALAADDTVRVTTLQTM